MADIEQHEGSVTVTTGEGHRITFAARDLGAPAVHGDIVTDWAGGIPPANPEEVVRAAKAEAEARLGRPSPSVPGDS